MISNEQSPDDSTEYKLGEWLHDRRGLPKYISNSAIFRVIKKGAKREPLWREPVAVRERRGVPDFEVLMSGIELCQNDCGIWLELCHLANQSNSEVINIGVREFLRRIGRDDDSGGNIGVLRTSLERLQCAQIQVRCATNNKAVTCASNIYASSLILRYSITQNGLTAHLDSNLGNLFSGYVSHISHDLRLNLKTDLAKFLLGFVSSDKSSVGSPNYVRIENLRKISGSRAEAPNFVKMLRRALKKLVDAGVLKKWSLKHKNTVLEYALAPSGAHGKTGWHRDSVQRRLRKEGKANALHQLALNKGWTPEKERELNNKLESEVFGRNMA